MKKNEWYIELSTRSIPPNIKDEEKAFIESISDDPSFSFMEGIKKIKTSGSLPSNIYGLPKIHKLHNPTRPIISTVKSENYKLTKFLHRILYSLVEDSYSYIMNDCDKSLFECVKF